ncbi:hypothetical protein [Silvanigrella aquatica]|uniref:Porin domain-containing protein n=1 Tax=Silvanigrella aquatica TaxID=1915309 RepID=A0A1L4D1E0_9BACT|nr:hypothetical protein [Silvanigrella aquatica]APJ04025.1 hypothetical protein AXG55_08935 [Silvanigrella aquatica]
MKKLLLRSLAVSALSLCGNNVFAQEVAELEEQKTALDTNKTSGSELISEEQIKAIKKEVAKQDPTKNTITLFGVAQFNANTSNTQRQNTPDFSANRLRLGVNVSGGIASGKAELEFSGNQQSTQTATSGVTSGDSGNGGVKIRQAQLNLDVLTVKSEENTYKTTVSLGGIRVGGADCTGPDIVWGASGYGRQDGAYLTQSLEFGKAGSLSLGLGAFNNINAFMNPAYPSSGTGFGGWGVNSGASIASNWGSPSFNGALGYLGNINAAYNIDENQSLKASFYYGTQENAPAGQDSSGNITSARNVVHTESNLVYNHKGIFGDKGVLSGNGISIFFENDDVGATQVANKSNGSVSYAPTLISGTQNALDDSQNTSILGLTVSADSGNYLTGMLQKGDRLTYAASYVSLNTIFGNSNYSQNYVANQAAASLGYAVNTFETAFNIEYTNSNKTIFSDATGKLNKNNAVRSYITAAYVF